MTEYDLLHFLHDWYPRHAATSVSAIRAMMVSLRRFFTFLREHEQVECAWAWPTLADEDWVIDRWETCPMTSFLDERMQDWQMLHIEVLAARVLVPINDAQGGFAWGDTMGPAEHRLHSELHARWLEWRDGIVRAGVVAAREVLALVLHRQQQWMNVANAKCGGLTPAKAIAEERRLRR